MLLNLEKDLAIDMGTSKTIIFEKEKGVVVREPTVVAVDKSSGKITKIGQQAEQMIGRTPAKIATLRPVSYSVICDYDIATTMLKELISRITSFSFFKPCIVCCVPSSVTGVEERAVIDAAIEAGARRVFLVENSVATALGAGLDISKPDGHMIVDIGGGTTEIGVVSEGGVVECESIKIAGQSFDEGIIEYVRKKYNLLIGKKTAEDLKKSIGCVIQRPDIGIDDIKGRCLATGLPKTVSINSNEIIEAFVEPMNTILNFIQRVIERTPPELVGDLDQNGIIVSGGGSLIYGVDRLIERSTGIKTKMVEDPITCAAYGAGKLLSHIETLDEGMRNFSRLRSLKG